MNLAAQRYWDAGAVFDFIEAARRDPRINISIGPGETFASVSHTTVGDVLRSRHVRFWWSGRVDSLQLVMRGLAIDLREGKWMDEADPREWYDFLYMERPGG